MSTLALASVLRPPREARRTPPTAAIVVAAPASASLAPSLVKCHPLGRASHVCSRRDSRPTLAATQSRLQPKIGKLDSGEEKRREEFHQACFVNVRVLRNTCARSLSLSLHLCSRCCPLAATTSEALNLT